MAAELCRGQEVRRGEAGRHQDQQPMGQSHLQQSPGTTPVPKITEHITERVAERDLAPPRLQESLGGRVRVMVTGAAPISPSVLNFLRAALGCQVMNIYPPF